MPVNEEIDIFDLNPDKLEEEWTGQAKLFHEYATKLADARRDHEQAKAAKELVEAELSEDVRLHPDRYKLEKVTEKGIETAIKLQNRYQVAHTGVIRAKHKVDVLQAMTDALDHRKKALENLVQLWLHDYYAEPKAPRQNREEVQEMERNHLRRKGQVRK